MNVPGAKTLTVASMEPVYSRSRSLWIRTASGPQTGFGHLKRCSILARMLRDCCIPTFLLDVDDRWSVDLLKNEGWDYCSRELESIWEVMPEPLAILIDTRLTAGLDILIAEAKRRGIPVVSIHDLGLSPLPSDFVIDGSVAASFDNRTSRGAVCYGGPDFMVLDPVYSCLHARRKPVGETIRSIYINLGGGDSERFFSKLLRGLKLWGQEAEVVGVPGFIPRVRENIGNQDWRPLRFRWENDGIERLLSEADLAITAGGISIYEALCAGTPSLVIAYDSLQQITINSLAARGACIDLGSGDDLDPAALCNVISLLDGDVERRRNLSADAKKIVDGQGAQRVSQIIRQSVQLRSAANQGRVSSVARIGI